MNKLKIIVTIFLLFPFVLGKSQWTTTSGVIKQISGTDDVLLSGTSMTGGGTKCYFDYGKKAFRGGFLIGSGANNWDEDSVGIGSFSFGYNTKAIGERSASFGSYSEATHVASFAAGNFSIAGGGLGSVAMGNQAEAYGDGSIALGRNVTNVGNLGSVALGRLTSVLGNEGAVAIGKSCSAVGNYGTVAMGEYSSVLGNNGSIAIGNQCTVTGDTGSVAIGYYNNAVGNHGSIAMGSRILTLGNQSIGIGGKMSVNGVNAMYLGHGPSVLSPINYNIANSMGIGFGSSVPTFFVGPSPTTSGTGNVGIATTTPAQKLAVNGAIEIGNTSNNSAGSIRFNGSNFQGYDGSAWVNLDDVSLAIPSPWIVSGSNIHYPTGNVGINTTNPSEKLEVDGDIRISNGRLKIYRDKPALFLNSTTTGALEGRLMASSSGGLTLTSFTNNIHLVVDVAGSLHNALTVDGASGYIGINTIVPTHELHVAGDVAIAGSIVHPSDVNLKENIKDITNGLSTINQLSPKSYTHKTDKAEEFGLSTKLQFGLIAQEVEKVLPEIVVEKALQGENGETYKGLDYEKLIPILVGAVNELSSQNQNLKQEVRTLAAIVQSNSLHGNAEVNDNAKTISDK